MSRAKPAGHWIGTQLAVAIAVTAALLAALPAHAQISTVRDAETEKMLREYADPIFAAAGLTPASVQILLVNDSTINAFVAVGQNMFIHTGLINEAELPNEIIGVISHETGHIAGGHLARMAGAASNATAPMIISLLLGAAAIAAGAPDVGAAVLMGGQQIAQRQFLAYNRTQEAAADQAAMTYLDRTKQSGRGLITFFDRFRDSEVMIGRSVDPYARSHPMPADRMAALEDRIAKSKYKDVKDTPERIAQLKMVQAKLHGFLDHMALVFRQYPETDRSLPGYYARAIAYYRNAQIEEALGEMKPLFAAQPDNPYFYELKAQILFESGRAPEAVPAARKATELEPDEPLLRIALGQALLASDQSETDKAIAAEAKSNLEIALRADRNNPLAWRELAVAHARLGDEAMADLATAERYFVSGAMPEAKGFALRAQRKLPKGSEAWQRANDILITGGKGDPGEETKPPKPRRQPPDPRTGRRRNDPWGDRRRRFP